MLDDVGAAVHSDIVLPLRLCAHQHADADCVPLTRCRLSDVDLVSEPPLNCNARLVSCGQIRLHCLLIFVELDEAYDSIDGCTNTQPPSLHSPLDCPFSQTFGATVTRLFLNLHHGIRSEVKLFTCGPFQSLSIETASSVADLLLPPPHLVLAMEQRAVSRSDDVVADNQSTSNFASSLLSDPIDIGFQLNAMIESAIPRKVLVDFPKVFCL